MDEIIDRKGDKFLKRWLAGTQAVEEVHCKSLSLSESPSKKAKPS